MKKASVHNPVFMLDEIDKLSHDFRGDPASALLEVLDPEQNHSFSDHYLDVSFDLSKVLFIATANILDPIPPALKDRMEVLELPGYTLEEKLNIAREHLIPRQIHEHGLTEKNIEITPGALEATVASYTREAGVRNLERSIAAQCRAVAVEVAEGKVGFRRVDTPDLADILGPERFFSEVAERTVVPGVATGLAWTPTGGDILFIESTRMRGKGNLTMTGQLGEVMQESARTALSFVRANAPRLGIDENFLEKYDVHIHVPAGAMPKDGPSAGVTMLSSLVSLLTGICARHDVAMTGEVTLRGAVLQVGGIKEKILAAHRAGIRRIVLPERNKKDLVEIPADTRNEIEFFFVSRMEDALTHTLDRNPFQDVSDEVLPSGGPTGEVRPEETRKEKDIAPPRGYAPSA
jgi:ATP-dependent Lon protease